MTRNSASSRRRPGPRQAGKGRLHPVGVPASAGMTAQGRRRWSHVVSFLFIAIAFAHFPVTARADSGYSCIDAGRFVTALSAFEVQLTQADHRVIHGHFVPAKLERGEVTKYRLADRFIIYRDLKPEKRDAEMANAFGMESLLLHAAHTSPPIYVEFSAVGFDPGDVVDACPASEASQGTHCIGQSWMFSSIAGTFTVGFQVSNLGSAVGATLRTTVHPTCDVRDASRFGEDAGLFIRGALANPGAHKP